MSIAFRIDNGGKNTQNIFNFQNILKKYKKNKSKIK